MKSFEFLQQYWEQIGKLLTYIQYCAGQDVQTPVCRDFWLGSVYVAVGIGLLIAFIIGKRILREQLEFRRNQKKLQARQLLEEQEAREREQARRNAEVVPAVDVSQQELAASIKQAMLKARAQEATLPARDRAGKKTDAAPGRELSAIMMTDIVGYSGSMERDEQRAYRMLLEHNNIVRAAVVKFRGREVKTIGDAFFVVFRSAADAVDCAISIQRSFMESNANKENADRIMIRVGIHLGEVMVTANDVFGDGVNIAARIEPLAEPGGICLSGEVYSVVRKKIEYKFEQLEGVKLKNIAIAPDIYRVVLT
ncbi:MAG: adenylate/guanylate cyclase domain-containing protein [Betaproteobacteria bacterium]|nr:adenylate/guanylate cyclase domain-containing protein [Betaproteobacteria bacterium]MBI3052861.1 adenylate/guanylate cyclase domain-containing protein [Betaproteobacteria bacterium]